MVLKGSQTITSHTLYGSLLQLSSILYNDERVTAWLRDTGSGGAEGILSATKKKKKKKKRDKSIHFTFCAISV